MKVPKSHPRYDSLRTRQLIEEGVEKGITSPGGLIAHGRGEAFDYLINEQTHKFSRDAIKAAAALLLLAKHPVISVNGNSAALVPKALIALARDIDAPLEINLFHESKKRLLRIESHLIQHGAIKVLLPNKRYKIPYLESNRKYVNPQGILKADVVFVPLEDGDRTKALIKAGKKVITVDLNPLSRTAKEATVTIVDNITRAMPILIRTARQFKNINEMSYRRLIDEFDNKKVLEAALNRIVQSDLNLNA